MNTIKFSEFNKSELTEVEFFNSDNLFFKNGDSLIKILKGYTKYQLDEMEYKLKCLAGLNINGFLIPNDLIYQDSQFIGYSSRYIEKSQSVYYKYSKDVIELKSFYRTILEVECIMKEAHKNGIILQDFHLENVMIDSDGKLQFIDIENCCVDGILGGSISILLKDYLFDFKHLQFEVSENYDRLSMFLSFIYQHYFLTINQIPKENIKLLKNRLETMRKCEKLIYILRSRFRKIPEIPTMDSIISLSDELNIRRF